jgi:hypothetical protein
MLHKMGGVHKILHNKRLMSLDKIRILEKKCSATRNNSRHINKACFYSNDRMRFLQINNEEDEITHMS